MLQRVELSTNTNINGYYGAVEIDLLIEKAKQLGMPGIAINDYHSIINYYRASLCDKDDFRIIYGLKTCLIKDIQSVLNKTKSLKQYYDIEDSMNRISSTVLIKKQSGMYVLLDTLYELYMCQHYRDAINIMDIPLSMIKENRNSFLLGVPMNIILDLKYCDSKTKYRIMRWLSREYDYVEMHVPIDEVMYDNNYSKEDIVNTIKYLNRFNIFVVATNDVCCVEKMVMSNGVYPKNCLMSSEELLKEFAFLGEEKAKEIVINNSLLLFNQIEKVKPVNMAGYMTCINNEYEKMSKIYEGDY